MLDLKLYLIATSNTSLQKKYRNVLLIIKKQWASQVIQRVKNPPAMQEPQETWVQFLSGEDALKEGMATHSSMSAWRILWTEEPGGLHSIGSQRVGHD